MFFSNTFFSGILTIVSSFVIANIPGIIEGVTKGKGLVCYFLRHIKRNSTLLFLAPVDTQDIKAEFDILVNELTKFSPEMLNQEHLLVIFKCDMLDDELKAKLKTELEVAFKDVPYIYFISCATRFDRIER